jgi:hypothetical protein
LLGCGYDLSTTNPFNADKLSAVVAEVVPDSAAQTCTATITRTISFGTSGGTVRAYAICRPA